MIEENKLVEIKTLVIGFGFSTLPLYRELDRTDEEYLIISDPVPQPIWQTLKEGGNLDFDLVSSYYTSLYSFNIVKSFKTDYYTPAKEYYDMHLEYYAKYKDKIIGDIVIKIENYSNYSLVYTRSGQVYKATNVVIALNFARKIVNTLATFDYKITNKTIVFNMIGDSINLMIAKLIGGNNKIVVLTNGFIALDKMFEHKGQTFTLDQLEVHNIGKHFPKSYSNIALGSPIWHKIQKYRSLKKKNVMFAGLLEKFYLAIGKIVCGTNFPIAYDKTIRSYDMDPDRLNDLIPIANGFIAIKYWPIDVFKTLFGDSLEKNIKNGYLLNDLPFFIDQGLVKCLDKSTTVVNKDAKTVINNGEEIKFDYFIDGDNEFPILPEIIIKHPNGDEKYEHVYRDNYFGVIPKSLSNIFHLGISRPTTGGLGNLTEMQCLLTHKMIHNDSFKKEINRTIYKRIEEYNRTHFSSKKDQASDHLVYYGFYTDEIAEVLGIDIKLSSCKSFKDFFKYFLFPNNAFKYRQRGEYKVEGCEELVDYIFDEHKWFVGLLGTGLGYYLYLLSFFAFIVKSYMVGIFSLPMTIILILALYIFKIMLFYAAFYAIPIFPSKYSLLRISYLICCIIATLLLNPIIFLPLIALDFLVSFTIRQLNPMYSRLGFNDLKVKRRYTKFFENYLKAFRSVRLNTLKVNND